MTNCFDEGEIMLDIKSILEYQEVDKKLYKIEREISTCPERKAYMQIKKFLATASEKLEQFEVKTKQIKGQMVELAKKYKQMEEALGEFEHMDDTVGDLSFYKKKALALNDTLKALKSEIAHLTKEINKTHDEYQDLKKQVIKKQEEGKDAQEKYDEVKKSREPEMQAIRDELAALKGKTKGEDFELYERKRKEKVFPVVVPVQGDSCYCSMNLSLLDIDKLKNGESVECSECHRVLYVK